MINDKLSESVFNRFSNLFNSSPLIVRAPGRVNLIGEHTDYNEGFVLPASIDKEIIFAIAINNDNVFRFHAFDFNETYTFKSINPEVKGWQVYLHGVLAQFEKERVKIPGIDCVFGGNIPVGSGLSSSAALECGFAYGLNILLETNFSPYKLITMAQKAEHEYAGVMCGIMDQFASISGKKDHVFRLDCRSHDFSYYPFAMDNYIIALVNSKVTHELASSEYNIRRKECEEGVAILNEKNSCIISLRDTNPDELLKYKSLFNQVTYNRCCYVVKENIRVLDACGALEKKDMQRFGSLMYDSHAGLKDEYEVSCPELDILVDITKQMSYVLGARMMGGGFGGCTINLIKSDHKDKFQHEITEQYTRCTGLIPNIYFVKLSDGARSLKT